MISIAGIPVACKLGKGLATAPAAIAVLTDGSDQQYHNFEIEDYAAAACAMQLAMVSLGYASVWLDSPYFDDATQKAACAVLGAPESHHLRVVLPVGIPDGPGSRRDKMSYDERVSYGRFGARK